MHRAGPLPPPYWPPDRLEDDRQRAVARFIEERSREGTLAYKAAFDTNEPIVRRLFELTNDLRDFTGEVFRDRHDLIPAARFLGGPPVSDDDLKTLVGGRLGRRFDADLARRVAEVLRAAWDPVRFPWLAEQRAPVDHERDAAIRWTAGIWAIERSRTGRRTESSRRQEQAVHAALQAEGYTLVQRRQPITVLDELERGTFCREVLLASQKADVPVRLRDGRLLALECKVSNSGVNSYKRLNHETGDKARTWRQAFGAQAVPGAVLAGVFTLANLASAQDNPGIALFWEHDLTPLRDFVAGRV
ncbi:MAG TPA: XamI family restriction endonuclease [Chloroflexota bacterium]|jgi:hypothetical protein